MRSCPPDYIDKAGSEEKLPRRRYHSGNAKRVTWGDTHLFDKTDGEKDSLVNEGKKNRKKILDDCLSVDIIKHEVREMGSKLNALQLDIKIILEELRVIQLIRSPSPKDSTEESHNSTYLVINETKKKDE